MSNSHLNVAEANLRRIVELTGQQQGGSGLTFRLLIVVLIREERSDSIHELKPQNGLVGDRFHLLQRRTECRQALSIPRPDGIKTIQRLDQCPQRIKSGLLHSPIPGRLQILLDPANGFKNLTLVGAAEFRLPGSGDRNKPVTMTPAGVQIFVRVTRQSFSGVLLDQGMHVKVSG